MKGIKLFLILIFLVFGVGTNSYGKTCKYVDKNGKTIFTNKHCPNNSKAEKLKSHTKKNASRPQKMTTDDKYDVLSQCERYYKELFESEIQYNQFVQEDFDRSSWKSKLANDRWERKLALNEYKWDMCANCYNCREQCQVVYSSDKECLQHCKIRWKICP